MIESDIMENKKGFNLFAHKKQELPNQANTIENNNIEQHNAVNQTPITETQNQDFGQNIFDEPIIKETQNIEQNIFNEPIPAPQMPATDFISNNLDQPLQQVENRPHNPSSPIPPRPIWRTYWSYCKVCNYSGQLQINFSVSGCYIQKIVRHRMTFRCYRPSRCEHQAPCDRILQHPIVRIRLSARYNANNCCFQMHFCRYSMFASA
jgi:hypothetical protein